MSLLDLLILSLAVWYLSYAITQTKGPFGVFTIIRQKLPLGDLTKCIYCLMPWLGFLFLGIMQTPIAWIVYPFAAAGVATFLFRYSGGGNIQ